MPRRVDSNVGELIVYVIIFAIVIVFNIVKSLAKKAADRSREAGGGRSPAPPARPAAGGEPASPEDALEEFFRQLQTRRAAGQKPASSPAAERAPHREPQAVPEHRPSPAPAPAPAPRPVPAARPAPAAPRAPAPRPAAAAPRQVLRRPKPPKTKVKATLSARRMLPSVSAGVSTVRRAPSPAELPLPVLGEARPAQAVSLDDLGKRFERREAAKAMVYLELFGPPRALRDYSGPPATG